MFRSRLAAAVAIIVLAAGSSGSGQQAGQDAPSEPQRPAFRAGVNFVRVDVIVTARNGAPIPNLTPEDFEVLEAGKPQKIETFKLISLDGGLLSQVDQAPRPIRSDIDEQSEAARDDVRLFGVFLDDNHVTRENSIRIRPVLTRFVESQLGPSDMIGLMTPLDPVSSVLHTRNHAAVVRGIETFEGRKYDYRPRTPQEEQWMPSVSAETIERMRNVISFGAIRSLILRMGGLKEGRKALILVSEGFSSRLPPQMRDPISGAPGVNNPFADDPDAGNPNAPGAAGLMASREEFAGQSDMALDLRDIYDLANRQNVAIYPLDPRGLAASEFGIDRNVGSGTDRTFLRQTTETLQILAENSDGRAIVNVNDMLPRMKQIVVDSSVYYLLGYASTVGKPDGKFHPIEVRLKRKGLSADVRHRKGYWALRPEDATRLSAPPKNTPPSAVETAMAASAAPRSRLVRTWLGTSKGDEGKTRLTLVWEAMPRPAGQAAREADRPARLTVTAVGADGTAHFRGASPAAGPAGARVSFDVPPGPLQLRLAVEGADADVLDSEVREIAIPDLTLPRAALGTPEVFRARSVAEAQRLKADAAAPPTAAREFSRTERLIVRIPAYGGSVPKLSARLLNRGGQSLADVPVAPAASPQSVPTVDLGLSNLPPGDYGLEIVLSGADGETAREVVAFKVTS